MELPEPHIQINGRTLTEAQAMAVRIAITEYRTELTEPSAKSALGQIADAYHARLSEVLSIILEQ